MTARLVKAILSGSFEEWTLFPMIKAEKIGASLVYSIVG
jgi:hypothetical protein